MTLESALYESAGEGVSGQFDWPTRVEKKAGSGIEANARQCNRLHYCLWNSTPSGIGLHGKTSHQWPILHARACVIIEPRNNAP